MFSFSLEGLTGGAGIGNKPSSSLEGSSSNTKELRHPFSGQERGDSLVSLSEEDLESGQREHRMFNQQVRLREVYVAHLEVGDWFLFSKYLLILGTKARLNVHIRLVAAITHILSVANSSF